MFRNGEEFVGFKYIPLPLLTFQNVPLEEMPLNRMFQGVVFPGIEVVRVPRCVRRSAFDLVLILFGSFGLLCILLLGSFG